MACSQMKARRRCLGGPDTGGSRQQSGPRTDIQAIAQARAVPEIKEGRGHRRAGDRLIRISGDANRCAEFGKIGQKLRLAEQYWWNNLTGDLNRSKTHELAG